MYFMVNRDPRPCWHCTSFGGMVSGGSAARCLHDTGAHIRAMPANGCAFWRREVGADDEPGPPTYTSRHTAATPARNARA